MTTFVGVGSPGAISSASGGKVYAYNAVSTTPALAAPANQNRQSVVFHNPGTINLYIAPANVLTSGGSNTPLSPTTGAVGGCFLLFPGAYLTLTGECQGQWNAFSASASNNPLTVMDSNV